MPSFSPPQAVRAAARRGLEMRRANNGKGGLDAREAAAQGIGSGVVRAQNLASGKSIPLETVKRMRSFFARHEKNKHGPNGKVAWALWGGDAGKRWADSIVAQEEKKVEKAMNAHQKQVAREVHGDEVSSSVPGHTEEETSSPAVPDRMVQANPRVLEQGHDTPMHDPITQQKLQTLGEESDGLAIGHRTGVPGASTMAEQQYAAGSPGPGRLEGAYDPTQHIALVIARVGSGLDTMMHIHKSEYDVPVDLVQVSKDGDLEKGLGDVARQAVGAAKKFGVRAAGAGAALGMAASAPAVSASSAQQYRATRGAEVTGKRLQNVAKLQARTGKNSPAVQQHLAGQKVHPDAIAGSGPTRSQIDKMGKGEGGAAQPEFQKSKLAKSLAEFLIKDAVGSRRGNIRRSYVDKFPNAVAVLEYQLSKALSGEVKLQDINVTQTDLLDATRAVTGRDLVKSADHVLRRRAQDTLASRLDAPEDLLYVRQIMKRGI